MEQETRDDTAYHRTLFHQKHHHSTSDTPGLDDNNQRVVTASDSSISLDVNITTLELLLSQQPTEIGIRVIPAKFNKDPELMFSNLLQIFAI